MGISIIDSPNKKNVFINILAVVGKVSYPIFLWHQVLLAYYRCYVSTKLDFVFWIIFIPVLVTLVYVSYLLEKKIVIKKIRDFIPWGIGIAILCGMCFIVWIRAGVIRDIPELNVYSDSIERRATPHYVDRIYDLDRPFDETDDKYKILVIGNSFARDFSNILLESNYASQIDLKYSFSVPNIEDRRLAIADYIFYYGYKEELPNWFFEKVSLDTEVYAIGTKNFGTSMEQVYVNRNNPNYYKMTACIVESVNEQNDVLKDQWGDSYIDIMSLLKTDYNHIRLFTDDNKFISYDGHHLARAGARYLARTIDLDSIFNSKLTSF